MEFYARITHQTDCIRLNQNNTLKQNFLAELKSFFLKPFFLNTGCAKKKLPGKKLGSSVLDLIHV